jgi:hypothetical protein
LACAVGFGPSAYVSKQTPIAPQATPSNFIATAQCRMKLE